jgi:transcriptional regulator of nitric oxide reductase
MDAMSGRVAEVVEHITERLFMERFAIDDHAVHVEDDGSEVGAKGSGLVRGGR